jgi:hypothetical protein
MSNLQAKTSMILVPLPVSQSHFDLNVNTNNLFSLPYFYSWRFVVTPGQ